MRRLLAAALLLAILPACGDDPSGRVARGLARMETLRGASVTLVVSATASGTGSVGGAIASQVRASGAFAAPDRLRLSLETPRGHLELIVIGERTWTDEGAGWHQSVRLAVGPLRDALAPLRFVRGPGRVSFAGVGFRDGAPTYRARIDLDAGALSARLFEGQTVDPEAHGTIELELGLFDDLVREETVTIEEPGGDLGTGLTSLRTRYTVSFRDLGSAVEIREPE